MVSLFSAIGGVEGKPVYEPFLSVVRRRRGRLRRRRQLTGVRSVGAGISYSAWSDD